jgi:deoxyribonuclease V
MAQLVLPPSYPETPVGVAWPQTAAELVQVQYALAAATLPDWLLPEDELEVGGCFVCFERGPAGPGHAGDRGWAGAALLSGATAVAEGRAGAAYEPGLLALREGRLLEEAVRRLPRLPDVLLVNATGRDHPRRAGLALHLGAVLGLPTVGVTHRALRAEGEWPPDETGADSPLTLESEVVGAWLRTRRGTRPLAVHAAWRTDPETAIRIVRLSIRGRRTPEPVRLARRVARSSRGQASIVEDDRPGLEVIE